MKVEGNTGREPGSAEVIEQGTYTKGHLETWESSSTPRERLQRNEGNEVTQRSASSRNAR